MATVIDLLNNDPRKISVGSARHPEKAHRPDNPIQRKPDWIRVKAPGSPGWASTQKIVKEHGLITVCEEASCPNIGECWDKKHATFMIMGDTCTRACAFCNVKTGMPGSLDPHEPEKIADSVAKLGLHHVVITSVDRDDLAAPVEHGPAAAPRDRLDQRPHLQVVARPPPPDLVAGSVGVPQVDPLQQREREAGRRAHGQQGLHLVGGAERGPVGVADRRPAGDRRGRVGEGDRRGVDGEEGDVLGGGVPELPGRGGGACFVV